MREKTELQPSKIEKAEEPIIMTLLDSSRTVLPYNYEEMISRQEKHSLALDEDFARHCIGILDIKKMAQELKERLINNVLINLGAGHSPFNDLIAEKLEVATNINVDLFYKQQLIRLEQYEMSYEEEKTIHPKTIAVQSDMLNFVARMKNESGNFMINGIDDCIIKNKEYIDALSKELIRATKKGGVIFGTESAVFVPLYKFSESNPQILEGSTINVKHCGVDVTIFKKST